MVVGCVVGEELLVCIGLNGDFGGDNLVNGSFFFLVGSFFFGKG